MHKNSTWILAMAGAFALTTTAFAASPGVAGNGAVTTELAAQANQNPPKKKPAGKPPAAHPHAAPKHMQAKPAVQHQPHPQQHKAVQPKNFPKNAPKNAGTPKFTPKANAVQKNNAVTPKAASKNAKSFTPHGPNATKVTAARIRAVPARGAGRAAIRGRNFSVWRGGAHRVRNGNGWRTFVALSALSAIAVGAYEYYPYAYIDAPEDYCDGLTEDGCQMVFQEVETEEGEPAGQCVAYCPWQ